MIQSARRYAEHHGLEATKLYWPDTAPSDWATTRLKYTIRDSQNGVWGEEADGGPDDVICVRVADFDRVRLRVRDDRLTVRSIPAGQRAQKAVQRGDLLLEKSGGGDLQPVGKVVLFDLAAPAVCSNFVARLRVAANHDARFLAYVHHAIYCARLNVPCIKQSTGIQNLDEDAYLAQKLPLPRLPEQQAITAFLDRETAKIDGLIAKRERQSELLAEKRTALISHFITRGLDPTVTMKDSGVAWLGEIPAHWQTMPLKRCASVQTGLAIGKKYGSQALVTRAYLRVANVQDGHILLDDMAEMAVPIGEARRHELQPGDVLMTEGGDFDKLGRGAVWHGELRGCLHQNHVFAVRPKPNLLLPEFLSALMSSFHGRTYFTLTSSQSTNLASTNTAKLGQFVVLRPPVSEQRVIMEFLQRQSAISGRLAERLKAAIDLLREHRTALITAAVTGQIEVRGEAQIPAVSQGDPE